MRATWIGELCFGSAILLLFFFLWQHFRKGKKTSGKIPVKNPVEKTSLFEEGTFFILQLLWKRKLFRMKRERIEKLRKIYIGKEEERIYYAYYGKILRKISGVMTIGLFLVSVSVFIKQEGFLLDDYFLEREEAGGNMKKYSIKADSGEEEKKLTVKLPDRKYTAEEEKKALKEGKQKLETVVLGENASAKRITKPLCLIGGFSENAISILWEIPLDSPVASDGTLDNADLKEPVQTELKAVLMCGESKEIWTKAVIIYPQQKKQSSFWEHWEREYEKSEKQSETERYVKLPETVDGKQMKYFEDRIEYPYLFLGILFLSCMLLPIAEESRLKEKIKKRQEQLSLDYPEFIEHFVLLIGAGLTVKGAWERIVQEYEKRRKEKETHFVYEEMAVTIREIENGMSEARAYELFGKRTEMLPYMKFCTLLVQNLKKGSADLLQLLEYEMTDSFQARKENAKALGEKAGTKLLMPMAVMLVIVFALILYAAFQNI
ncbi:MAG: type II secretion system F family protein [Lachnospiraceae bacterium]|nr:type II secretion system F family protein [Lachnospiraceae bacterium]